MMKILVAFDTIDEGFEPLYKLGEVIRPPKGRDFTRSEILEQISGTDILCSVFDIPIDKEIIDKGLPTLKLIANYAVGFNNIDIAYAREKGITVTNTPHSVVEPTADLTFSLLLGCTRRLVEWHNEMHQFEHQLSYTRLSNLGIDLYHKTLGILGFGNIGKAVARRAKAFGMEVMYNKRTRLSPSEEQILGITYASKEDLIKQSDVISVHTPLTEQTHHYIGATEFSMMKPEAIFINTSRGPVVDEKALIDALKNKQIYAAGLDVFEFDDKPLPDLYTLKNVVITPHIGTQTYDARKEMLCELCDNIIGFIRRDRKISIVN